MISTVEEALASEGKANVVCDRCSARAKITAEKNNMSLLFCGHHAKEHIDALEDKDWEVTAIIF